jgi:ABC-type transport system substrate-binding protein
MPSSQENTALGQVIAEQWQEVGVDVEVEAALESDFGNRLILGDYDAMLLPFYNRSDPDEHYHFWDPDGIGPEGELSINLARWTNETVGDALRAARQTADVAEREALYATVWEEWAKEFPYLWIYHGTYVIIADDAVHGLDSFTFPDGEPAEVMDWGAPFLTGVWRE